MLRGRSEEPTHHVRSHSHVDIIELKAWLSYRTWGSGGSWRRAVDQPSPRPILGLQLDLHLGCGYMSVRVREDDEPDDLSVNAPNLASSSLTYPRLGPLFRRTSS